MRTVPAESFCTSSCSSACTQGARPAKQDARQRCQRLLLGEGASVLVSCACVCRCAVLAASTSRDATTTPPTHLHTVHGRIKAGTVLVLHILSRQYLQQPVPAVFLLIKEVDACAGAVADVVDNLQETAPHRQGRRQAKRQSSVRAACNHTAARPCRARPPASCKATAGRL